MSPAPADDEHPRVRPGRRARRPGPACTCVDEQLEHGEGPERRRRHRRTGRRQQPGDTERGPLEDGHGVCRDGDAPDEPGAGGCAGHAVNAAIRGGRVPAVRALSAPRAAARRRPRDIARPLTGHVGSRPDLAGEQQVGCDRADPAAGSPGPWLPPWPCSPPAVRPPARRPTPVASLPARVRPPWPECDRRPRPRSARRPRPRRRLRRPPVRALPRPRHRPPRLRRRPGPDADADTDADDDAGRVRHTRCAPRRGPHDGLHRPGSSPSPSTRAATTRASRPSSTRCGTPGPRRRSSSRALGGGLPGSGPDDRRAVPRRQPHDDPPRPDGPSPTRASAPRSTRPARRSSRRPARTRGRTSASPTVPSRRTSSTSSTPAATCPSGGPSTRWAGRGPPAG